MTNEAKTEPDEGGSWTELRRMADEVKLKLHLAGMELKERWAAFEPRVQAVQARVEARGEEAVGAVQEQVLHVVDGLRKLLDDLRADISGGRKQGERAAAVSGEGADGSESRDADHPRSG
jgi:hypothetical protein